MTTATAFKPAAIGYADVTETELHILVAEASDLGWPVGVWPATVETTIGNGQRLQLWSASREYRTYRQALGVIVLRVFND